MRKARVTPLLLSALLVGGVARAAGTQPAAAEGPPSVVHLDVDAPADCTTREELAARVAARSNRIRFAEGTPVGVRVTVARVPGGRIVAGQLTVTRPDAPPAVRRITAESCEQASDGLALILALALDPDWPESPASATRAPTVVNRAPIPAAPQPPTIEAAPLAPSVPAARARTGWSAEVGVEAIVGPAPRAMPAIRVGARLTRDGAASVWSPALVLSVLHAWTGDLDEPGGTAGFTLDAANLDACPLRLAAAGWEARACASILAGRLQAAGSNTYAPTSVARPFAAGGASVLAAVGLGQRLVVGARFEAAASWIRDAYAFSPTVFHRAAAVTLSAGLSLGVRFR